MENTCDTNEKPKNSKEFFKSSIFWKPALGVIIGGIAGFAYYYFVGCATGTCAITSNPVNSVLFGSLLGFLVTKGPCTLC